MLALLLFLLWGIFVLIGLHFLWGTCVLPDPVVGCRFYLVTRLSFLGGRLFFFLPYSITELLHSVFSVILNYVLPHPLSSWNDWWGHPLSFLRLGV